MGNLSYAVIGCHGEFMASVTTAKTCNSEGRQISLIMSNQCFKYENCTRNNTKSCSKFYCLTQQTSFSKRNMNKGFCKKLKRCEF